MSWSLYAVPLHDLARAGMAEWAAEASFSHGVPDRAPEPRALPSVTTVLTPDTGVGHLAFRKPVGAAVLAALCALAPVGGPQLVFDDSADRVFVVQPGDLAEDLTAIWPW